MHEHSVCDVNLLENLLEAMATDQDGGGPSTTAVVPGAMATDQDGGSLYHGSSSWGHLRPYP